MLARTSHARTLAELVEALATASPERGLTFVDERFAETRSTWREIHGEAARVASALQREGIEPGQRLLVPVAATPAGVTSLLGALLAGAVPLTLAATASPAARSLSLAERCAALARRHGVAWELAADVGGSGQCEPRRTSVARDAWRDSSLALIQFSSGTTSSPKGIELTHHAVLANLALAAVVDARESDAVHVTWLPLHHDMGLVGGLLATLPSAHELVLMDTSCFVLRPLSWLEALSRHRATSTAAPDFALAVTWQRWAGQSRRRPDLDLSALRSIHDGAEPVRPANVRRFTASLVEQGLRPNVVRPVYGLAEATLLVSAPEEGSALVTRRFESVEIPSVGRALPGFELRIVEPGGARELAPGSRGEIVLRGDSLFRGYHQDEEATRASLVDGWLRTGDEGVLDESGRLFITGRLKDLLIVAGRNYLAHEVADVVDELPLARRGHSHAVAIPWPDNAVRERAEEIVVLVSPASRMTRSAQAVVDAVADTLARLVPTAAGIADRLRQGGKGLAALARPRIASTTLRARVEHEVKRHLHRELGLVVDRVELVSRLPKTSSGKVRRGECVALALARRTPVEGSTSSPA